MSIKYKPVIRGYNSLFFEMDKKYETVSVFLGEITTEELKNWYLEGIDKVLDGESDVEERDGEMYGLLIKKDITKAYDMFDNGQESYISTIELRELIECWFKEFSDHKYRSDLN